MEPIRVVFQGGIELKCINSNWIATSGVPTGGVVYPSLREAALELHPLKIVLITENRGHGESLTLLLQSDGKTVFGVALSDLINRSLPADLIYPIHDLAYLVGSVSYHCQRLTELYVQISSAFARVTQIPGGFGENGVAMFGYQREPYYELDALIGSARRAFDSMRIPLWYRFGTGRGTRPRSLKKLLEGNLPLPDPLRKRLAASWEEIGVPLASYRDCIHHYMPIDFGLASARMERLEPGIWIAKILIPDNPEARSKKKFTFALGLDALEYSLQITNELLVLSQEVIDATVPEDSVA